MKIKTSPFIGTLGLVACIQIALSQPLTIPSDGSDGIFAPTTNSLIDLRQAVTGTWNANNSNNVGKGVYDQEKWAIVFKYQSVNIPSNQAGAVVRFINHPSHAPVVWLVQEDVTIDGIVDLSGDNRYSGAQALIPAEPGPGGFRGGPFGPDGLGAGLGPGGGLAPGLNQGGASYASKYGNPKILPLIGGSGSGASDAFRSAGSAGGGALLIAARGVIRINGKILAKGTADFLGFPSSGGAVRIVARDVTGVGEINALPDGRIRIEAPSFSSTVRTFPETIAVPPDDPPLIWPPNNAPKVRIVSVDGVIAPADPTAPLISSADIGIQNNQPVVVVLETRNFPIEGVVDVRSAPKFNGGAWVRALYETGTHAVATWRATNTFLKGFTTLQARATAP